MNRAELKISVSVGGLPGWQSVFGFGFAGYQSREFLVMLKADWVDLIE